jgi:hypothetical protein
MTRHVKTIFLTPILSGEKIASLHMRRKLNAHLHGAQAGFCPDRARNDMNFARRTLGAKRNAREKNYNKVQEMCLVLSR